MRSFRKKPVVVQAERWWKAGDVPEAPIVPHEGESTDGTSWTCAACGHKGHEHGRCETLEGWHIVCPGDWIIKGVKGEFYPCKPDIFAETYEPILEEATA